MGIVFFMTNPKIYQDYTQIIQQHFPDCGEAIVNKSLIKKELISPFCLSLPKIVLEKVKEFVSQIESLVQSQNYRDQLPSDQAWETWPHTPSLLTCFDFHYNPEQGLKLIEVNTNASLYITSHYLYLAQGLAPPDPDLLELKKAFADTFSLTKTSRLVIADREPQNEGLYFEFLLYKEWLEQLGHQVSIEACSAVDPSKIDGVYNRSTDFYFDQAYTASMKAAYLQKSVSISPNPLGYFLLADKKRLHLMRDQIAPDLQNIIPRSQLFKEFESKEELWSQRKKFFFKPSQSYGSKAVFNGKGISHKAFEGIYAPDFLAQELCPAGQQVFEMDGEDHKMKFDLRFYSFAGRVQSYMARLYQGQATNMRTPLGGIAPLRFA